MHSHVSNDVEYLNRKSPPPSDKGQAFISLSTYEKKASVMFHRYNQKSSENTEKYIEISIFDNESGTRVRQKKVSLPALADMIETTVAQAKSELPLFKLASFGRDRSNKGSLRTNANMIEISGIEADYDAGKIPPNRAADILADANIAGLIYTTPSHRQPGKGNRWRALLPCSRPLDPKERERLVARLQGRFQGALAAESFTQSQAYYFGSVEDGTPVRTYLVDGDYIDRADDLDEGAIGRDGRPYQERRERQVDGREVTGATRPQHVADAALMAIPNEGSRDWWRDRAAAHKAAGGSFEVFDEWSRRHQSYSKRHTRETWESLEAEKEGGITERSLYREAEQHGWHDAEKEAEHQADILADFQAAQSTAEERATALIKRHLRNSQPYLKSANGRMLSNIANAMEMLRTEKPFVGNFRFNEIGENVLYHGRPLADRHIAEITERLQRKGLNQLSEAVAYSAIKTVASEFKFHPVRDHLNSVEHDGRRRLDNWLTRYVGAEDNDYTAAVSRYFLISMVARIMRPGCKVDHTLILEGRQGIGKSTVAEILAYQPKYFADSLPDLGSKDAAIHLRGRWVVEIAELEAMRKAEATELKAFLTRTTDKFREPYGKTEIEVPRQNVFIGSTNSDAYLKDPTGARRFWPIRCGKIDTDALRRDRDQLFAEALAAFNAGEQWWPNKETENRLFAVEQASRLESDIWEEPIAAYLDGDFDDDVRDRVTASELLEFALNKSVSHQTQSDKLRVASVLKTLGWHPSNSGDRAWRRNAIIKKVRGIR
ncbi:VapE domain-containing protein [Sinorhizobium fredii]|nr:VapE domain-containing protein [Sinorhizobium fredii]GEC30659.1 hypothetical protein EFR01_08300 [Sinorhizobium fredii]GLS06594.1 hypothetical protein GCM10007864_02190 [Sinorhizobium fredii]